MTLLETMLRAVGAVLLICSGFVLAIAWDWVHRSWWDEADYRLRQSHRRHDLERRRRP